MRSFQILERRIEMKIEKHIFNVSSTAANIEDVTAWLQENASEYFDSISCDTSTSFITCTTGTRASLSFAIGKIKELQTVKIVLENGAVNNKAHGSSGSSPGIDLDPGMITHGIKTSAGISLEYSSGKNNIIITKTNLGSTGIFVKWFGLLVYGNSVLTEIIESCDLIHSSEIQGTAFQSNDFSDKMVTAVTSGYYFWSNNKPTGLTMLVPFCFIGASYAPGMYLTVFSQYPKQTGNLICDGVEYYYNGYVALKE